jgi:hypothetical protein
VHGDDQLGRDLAVGQPAGDQFGDPPLGGREVLAAAGSPGDAAKLGGGALGEHRGAEPLEDLPGLPERRAG